MSKEKLNIQYLNEPGEGKKQWTVKSDDGRKFGLFADKKDWFKTIPGLYEIDYTSKEYQGKTYHTVTSATLVNGTNGNGAPTSNGSTPASERGQRIERQHSQHMAILHFQMLGKTPETLAEFWMVVDEFQADIDKSPVKEEAPF